MENNGLGLMPEQMKVEKPKFYYEPTFEATEQIPVYDADGNQTGAETRVTGRILKKVWTDEEEIKNDLRRLRNSECFPIINRGQLWYDTLTEPQKIDLKDWYNAWLNVTITKSVPSKPYWIK